MAEVAVAETEMAAALMAAYDALVEKVKARRPIGSDKKPTELGFVYSQLIQGLLVDPRDYTAPWSPMGGSSMQDAIEKGAAPAKAASPAPADDSAPAAAEHRRETGPGPEIPALHGCGLQDGDAGRPAADGHQGRHLPDIPALAGS